MMKKVLMKTKKVGKRIKNKIIVFHSFTYSKRTAFIRIPRP